MIERTICYNGYHFLISFFPPSLFPSVPPSLPPFPTSLSPFISHPSHSLPDSENNDGEGGDGAKDFHILKVNTETQYAKNNKGKHENVPRVCNETVARRQENQEEKNPIDDHELFSLNIKIENKEKVIL